MYRLIQSKFVKFMEGDSNILISATNLQNIDKNSQHQEDVYEAEYYIYKRVFRSNRGLLHHLNTWRGKNNLFTERNGFNVEAPCTNASRWTIQEDPRNIFLQQYSGGVFFLQQYSGGVFFRRILRKHTNRLFICIRTYSCYHLELLVRDL